eukprot:TRINITY_DN10124_c0_g1_i1.p1 TRINITY_DN10124_c0_g1~~TRINITY_DN10124_c0_g1_i1.p1  ORF type:complete len:213 (+),score=30.36 TRINITY_DN10124_c0_g1_i1:86-724(+)
MKDPAQMPVSKPCRPPHLPLPLAARCTAGFGAAGAPGRAGKPKGLTVPLDIPPNNGEDGGSQVFSMATPRGESTVERHYMGTPRASSILSAFLDFDDSDVTGPPLDPDYGAVNAVGIGGSVPPLDFDDDDLAALVERHAEKKSEGDDSVSSGSTRATEGEDGSAASLAEDEDSTARTHCERPTFALDDDAAADEEYEEDFESDSDSESEDES